jgi:hypothetical protein
VAVAVFSAFSCWMMNNLSSNGKTSYFILQYFHRQEKGTIEPMMLFSRMNGWRREKEIASIHEDSLFIFHRGR